MFLPWTDQCQDIQNSPDISSNKAIASLFTPNFTNNPNQEEIKALGHMLGPGPGIRPPRPNAAELGYRTAVRIRPNSEMPSHIRVRPDSGGRE